MKEETSNNYLGLTRIRYEQNLKFLDTIHQFPTPKFCATYWLQITYYAHLKRIVWFSLLRKNFKNIPLGAVLKKQWTMEWKGIF